MVIAAYNDFIYALFIQDNAEDLIRSNPVKTRSLIKNRSPIKKLQDIGRHVSYDLSNSTAVKNLVALAAAEVFSRFEKFDYKDNYHTLSCCNILFFPIFEPNDLKACCQKIDTWKKVFFEFERAVDIYKGLTFLTRAETIEFLSTLEDVHTEDWQELIDLACLIRNPNKDDHCFPLIIRTVLDMEMHTSKIVRTFAPLLSADLISSKRAQLIKQIYYLITAIPRERLSPPVLEFFYIFASAKDCINPIIFDDLTNQPINQRLELLMILSLVSQTNLWSFFDLRFYKPIAESASKNRENIIRDLLSVLKTLKKQDANNWIESSHHYLQSLLLLAPKQRRKALKIIKAHLDIIDDGLPRFSSKLLSLLIILSAIVPEDEIDYDYFKNDPDLEITDYFRQHNRWQRCYAYITQQIPQNLLVESEVRHEVYCLARIILSHLGIYIDEQDPLWQKAQEIISYADPAIDAKPNDPFRIHKKIQDSYETPLIEYTPKSQRIYGRKMALNIKTFQREKKIYRVQDLPLDIVKPNSLETLFVNLKRRIDSTPTPNDLYGYIQSIYSNITFGTLATNFISNFFLNNLLKIDSPPEAEISAPQYYFFIIVRYILSLSNEINQASPFSPQEQALLDASYYITNCSSGQTMAIITYYNLLPIETRLSDDIAQDHLKLIVDQLFEKTAQKMMNIVIDSKDFLREAVGRKHVSEVPHQSLYIRNLISRHIGLRHTYRFDISTHVLHRRLLKWETNELVELFYKHFTLKLFVKEIERTLAELFSLPGGYVYSGLEKYFEDDPANKKELEWQRRYFIVDDDTIKLKGLTEFGMQKILYLTQYAK